MDMWNGIDMDLCEKKVIITDDNEELRVTATEYYLNDEQVRRDVHVEIKKGLKSDSLIGA